MLRKPKSGLKVALVHDHLVQDGGAERVLRSLMKLYPEAPIYTLVYDPAVMGEDFAGREIRTSIFQRWGFARQHYKWLLTWIDWAFRRFDLSEYDVVISSASGWAKSVRTSSQTVHICYCHTPIRYIWSDADRYIAETGYPPLLKWIFRQMLGYFRRRDRRAVAGVDHFIANSGYVAERIRKYYGREAAVIYPPVDVDQFAPADSRDDYFLVATRLEPYKRVDLVIEAANRQGFRLKIMGRGTEQDRLLGMAGPTVEFTGRVVDAERKQLFGRARAFINPQNEDFGITVVEALASGTPVIAFGEGGAAEVIQTGVHGRLFKPQTVEALTEVLRGFDPATYDVRVLQRRAKEFSEEVFMKRIAAFVTEQATDARRS